MNAQTKNHKYAQNTLIKTHIYYTHRQIHTHTHAQTHAHKYKHARIRAYTQNIYIHTYIHTIQYNTIQYNTIHTYIYCMGHVYFMSLFITLDGFLYNTEYSY
jgi:hypothetical protein